MQALGRPGMTADAAEQARVSDFLDPDDPALFPRLTRVQLEQLDRVGHRLDLAPGEVVFGQGSPGTPFFVVLDGAVDIVDRRPEGDRHFTQCRGGTFIGDIAIFTGEPTIAAGVAAGATSLLAVAPEALRTLVARSGDLGDLILRTMVARREWLQGHGYGHDRLIGSRASREAFELRELLQRNLVPFTWRELESDGESRALLGALGVNADDCPVLVRTNSVLRRPSVEDVADVLGLRAQVDGRDFDVVIVGAGPAGLASAVYAASEGLSTLIVDEFAPGGQAGTSARIENYLGFPTGLPGSELARRATLQPRKFGAVISSLHRACEFGEPDERGRCPVGLGDGQRVRAGCVVLAAGANYQRLTAAGAPDFEGRGLYYAATHLEALQTAGRDVVVVGGGNSAGQAVMNLSGRARKVHMVVRRPLEAGMSRYLIDRIVAAPNVEIWTGWQIRALHGEDGLDAVTIGGPAGDRQIGATAVFAMIGASPRTTDLRGIVALDADGYIVTGKAAPRQGGLGRDRLLLETTRPNVFAVGDVRSGSTKRVASAVGDSALVIRSVHESLRSRA